MKSDGCWEWVGYRQPFGHGRFGHDGLDEVAHRYSWRLAYGEIPKGMAVLHRCDNPPCVRPDHLFLGDRRANIADMDAKGRRRPGDQRAERNSQSKLSWPVVREIRAARAAGEPLRTIGSRYGVSDGLVSKIARGHIWME